ncbi:MAG: hypothetical protein WC423_25170 [Vulcanimicrobiota bacterium]
MLKQPNSRGLTIAEGLVSMGLVLLLMGIITHIVGRWSHVFRFTDDRLERIETVGTAMATIRGEVEGAQTVEISSPTQLVLRQTVPRFSFPDPLRPAPAGWTWDEITVSEITYLFDAQALRRLEDSGTDRLITDELAGFAAAQLANENVQVRLSIDTDGVLQVFSMEIWRP